MRRWRAERKAVTAWSGSTGGASGPTMARVARSIDCTASSVTRYADGSSSVIAVPSCRLRRRAGRPPLRSRPEGQPPVAVGEAGLLEPGDEVPVLGDRVAVDAGDLQPAEAAVLDQLLEGLGPGGQ